MYIGGIIGFSIGLMRGIMVFYDLTFFKKIKIKIYLFKSPIYMLPFGHSLTLHPPSSLLFFPWKACSPAAMNTDVL